MKQKKVEGIMIASGFWYPFKEEEDTIYLTNKKVSNTGVVYRDQTFMCNKDQYDKIKKVRRTR